MNNQIKSYRENPALNQSKLKKLIGFKPWEFLKDDKEETESLKLGSLVDCLFLTPQEFNNEFYVSIIKQPSDTMKNIVTQYYNFIKQNDGEPTDFYHTGLLLSIANEHNYCPTYKSDTLLNKITKEGLSYLQELKVSEGLTIVNEDMLSKAQAITMELSNFIGDHSMFFDDKIQYIQKPLYGNYCSFDIKGLLDMLLIDIENHKFQIIDLKTTSGATMEFPESLRKYRYDIQMAWYSELVRQNARMLLQDNGITDENTLSNCQDIFDIECFFLVASTIPNHTEPILVKCDEDILIRGKYGYSVPTEHLLFGKDGKPQKLYWKTEGYNQLILKYIKYMSNGFTNNTENSTEMKLLNWNEIK